MSASHSPVGISFGLNERGRIIVTGIARDGPAKRYVGAVQEGDVLTHIDSQNVEAALRLEPVHQLLAGQPGSPVTLTFRRKISGSQFQITVARNTVGKSDYSEFNDVYFFPALHFLTLMDAESDSSFSLRSEF